ncbi:MAG TPA: sugar phosphate nucleotidyltransferase [Gammaproteobacteria bacterium]|nr:sugar phosphate nucleotidyltransferase [Gammaproteobacteria bacterium]
MINVEHRAARRTAPPRLIGQTWAVVLAGGDGTRLRSLTADAGGQSVPKQYCSLRSGPSLLEEALVRAETVADRERVCTVVAAQHRRWWAPLLAGVPRHNVIAQPQNRGTANGMLLALSCVLDRDPLANVVVLPSDHCVRDETTLCSAVHRSLRSLRAREADVVLLGVAPEEADSELGYIVPSQRMSDAPVGVRKFVEKPPRREAAALIAAGALWNAFIVVAHALSLLDLLRAKDAALVERMRTAWRLDAQALSGYSAVAELYRTLPALDFSRDIAEGRESSLSVMQVPPCGWSDLGTPERIVKALRRPVAVDAHPPVLSAAALSLEERLRQRQAASIERVARCGAEPLSAS